MKPSRVSVTSNTKRSELTSCLTFDPETGSMVENELVLGLRRRGITLSAGLWTIQMTLVMGHTSCGVNAVSHTHLTHRSLKQTFSHSISV